MQVENLPPQSKLQIHGRKKWKFQVENSLQKLNTRINVLYSG